MFVLGARNGEVRSLAFSPDAGTLYAAHRGSGVHVWDIAARTSRPLEVGGKGLGANGVVLPGGRWAFGTVLAPLAKLLHAQALLDLRTGADYPFNYMTARGVAVAPDGSRIFALGGSGADKDRPRLPGTDSNRLYGWALTDAGPRYAWHRDYPQGTCAWAVGALGPDRLAVDEEIRTNTPSVRWIVIRRAADGHIERSLVYDDWRVDQLLGSPDGTKLVARQGAELRVWDATDWGKPPVAVEGKDKGSMTAPAACFHPTAPYLLLANGGPSVLVFDTNTWKQARKWRWDAGGVLRTVTISPDGALAAAGGTAGAVVVWDLDL